jgi:hypothetical protein
MDGQRFSRISYEIVGNRTVLCVSKMWKELERVWVKDANRSYEAVSQGHGLLDEDKR